MRKATTTLVLTTALLTWTGAAARAQDKPSAEAPSADAAEEAFLKAYFAEKELKDYAAAEKAYAGLQSAFAQASHEVLGRATLGRARCLRELKRVDEADALFAKVEKDFADVKDVAAESHAALQASTSKSDGSLDARIRADLSLGTWRNDAWKYGERGVPTIVAMLRDDSPEMVYRAAETLARMESGQAHDALVNVLDGRAQTTYPEQVRNAALSDYVRKSVLTRLAEVKDAEVRTNALKRLVFELGDAKATETVLSDAAVAASFIESRRQTEGAGRFLVAALARGGDTRDAALRRLRGEPLDGATIAGLFDPPAAVLADAEAVAAIAPHVVARARAVADNKTPSPALVAAFTRFPETAVVGVQWTLGMNRPSADAAAFVAALGRVGFCGSSSAALTIALGPKPSPELLKKLAAAWPDYRDWTVEGERLPHFLRELIKSGVTDEASLLAFQEGLAPQPSQLHRQFVEELKGSKDTIGAWAAKAFLRELALKTDRETHQIAAIRLLEWQQSYGDAAGLSSHVPEIVAALGQGGSDQLIEVLACFGQRSIDALKSALPTHPHKAVVVEALAQLGDKSSADAIEQVLAEASEIADDDARTDDVKTAATALMRIRGAAAKDALATALVAHGGRDAQRIFEAISDFDRAGVAFGKPARFELCKIAIEKAPGVVDAYPDATNRLTTEMLRALAVLALGSASIEDRRWGANQEKYLLDAAAWDALLAAAQDSDNDLRDTSREALRAIRAKENEMAEFRAMGEERATRKRIETLLASKSDEQRRAGVAAIAATNLAGMVNELIRLAAEDESDNVRDDARRALLALAKPAVPAPQPPAEKK